MKSEEMEKLVKDSRDELEKTKILLAYEIGRGEGHHEILRLFEEEEND